MEGVLFIAFSGISFLATYLLSKIARKRGIFIDIASSKGHGVHEGAVPRVGGTAVFFALSLLFLYAILNVTHEPGDSGKLLLVWIFGFLFFIVGVLEDAGLNIKPRLRFMVFSLLALIFLLLSLNMYDREFFIYDFRLFKIPLWFAFPFTWVAIVGLVNAINISDGLDGLSSGIVLIAFAFLGIILHKIGDDFLSFVFAGFSSVLFGFWVINFLLWRIGLPGGLKMRVFLGDSGTYMLGFISAVFSIWAVNRNGLLSPGAPFILFFYPVWETLNSMARRVVEGRGVFEADNQHFHNFLYLYFGKSHVKATSLILFIHLAIGVYTLFMFSEGEYLILAYSVLISVYSIFYLALEKTVFRGMGHIRGR